MLNKLVLAGLALCASASVSAAGFYAQSGKIYDAAGNRIQVRGISHFGFNDGILQPEYLWSMGWKDQIAQIKALGFNAVRLPFVPDTLYNTTPVDRLSYVDPNKNADILGKTPLQVMDMWMAEADRQGLYVMLDFHSLSKVRQYPTWWLSNPSDFSMVYNNQAYTQDEWIRDLKFIAQRYANLAHFFAIDIDNEPNSVVRWSTGDPNTTNPAYYWKAAAESAASAILAVNPNLLIFVQGINGNFDGVENPNLSMNWGEDFQPEAYQPLNIPANKLVLSPHTYGPDVYMKSSFGAPNFPANLPADWDTLFGKLYPAHPVIVGEWGGKYGTGSGGQMDVTWQNAFVQYLLSKGISDSFYWCYTPNSGDTGGILDDNLNVRQDKMALLRQLWGGAAPTPGTLAWTASGVSVNQTAGSLTVSVARSAGSSGMVSVSYATVDGTAKAGSDYTAGSGTLSWAAGDISTKSFAIPVSAALPFLGTRNFMVKLTSPAGGATLGSPSTQTVTINGAAAGVLKLSATSYTVAQNGGSLTVTVNRASGTLNAVSVLYGTADSTAKAGSDYTAKSGTLSWPAGDGAAKTFTIPISNATPVTGTKGFSVKIYSPAGGAQLGGPSSSSVTITGSKAAAPPSYTAPYITSWSPTSGKAGTVVTINGTGFTGIYQAWAGSAHDAGVTAVSDTQVKVTIPADATSGAIGIDNPQGWAFTPSSFTVTQ